MQQEDLDKLKTLPPEVVENYYDPEINELYVREIFPLLEGGREEKLNDLILDVYLKKVGLSDFLRSLRGMIKEEVKYKEAAIKILGKDLLLVEEYLQAGVMSQIEALGGDPNLFRYFVPAITVADQVITRCGLQDIDEHLLQRLAKVVSSRILNARTPDQFKTALTGPAKTSGVGLTEEKALEVMKVTDEKVAVLVQNGVRILSDDDYLKEIEKPEEPTAEAIAEESAAAEAAAVAGEDQGEVGPEAGAAELEVPPVEERSEEEVDAAVQEILSEQIQEEPVNAAPETAQTVLNADIQEIKRIEKALTPQAAKTAQAEISVLDRLVDDGVAGSGLKFDNDDMKRRFKNLVNLFFRDLRDSLETRSKLTMLVASGGLGLTDAEADRVMGGLEVRAKEYHKLMDKRTEQEKQQFVAVRAEQVLKEEEEAARREKEKLDKTFSRLTASSNVKEAVPADQPGQPASLPPIEPTRPKFIPVVAVSAKSAVSPVSAAPAVTPVPPPPAPPKPPTAAVPLPSKLPAAPAAALAAPKGATAPPPAKLPIAPLPPPPPLSSAAALPSKLPAAPVPPPPAPPKPPTATVPLPPKQVLPPAVSSGPEAKVVMADVKFVRKLTGPVDELRSMTVKDFRRLSRDPHEATLKLRDKIDLLEEQSFEIKTAGIKAWQDSEVNRLYLTMLRKSLEGKPIMEVIAEREAKDEPALSKAEFDAVMELNRKLRFG